MRTMSNLDAGGGLRRRLPDFICPMPVENSPPSCSAFNSNSRFRRTRAGERRLLAKASPAGLFLTITYASPRTPGSLQNKQSHTSTDPVFSNESKHRFQSRPHCPQQSKAHQSFPIPNSTVTTLSKCGRLLTKYSEIKS